MHTLLSWLQAIRQRWPRQVRQLITPPARTKEDRPSQVLGAILAAFLIAAALARSNGLYNERSFWMVTQAFALLSITWLVPYRSWFEHWCSKTIPIVLTVTLIWELILLFQVRPLLYGNWQHADELLPFYQWSLLTVVAAFVSVISQKRWVQYLCLVLLLGCIARLGQWTISSSPHPTSPMQISQQQAAQRFWQGENPYQAGPEQQSEALPSAAQVELNDMIYHDMPYALRSSALAERWIGDHRYSIVLAWLLVTTVLFLIAPARALVAVTLLWLMPRGLFMLEQGWIEPLVLLPLLGVILCSASRLWPLLAAWFLTSKQDMICFVPLLWLLPPLRQGYRQSLLVWLQILAWCAILLLPYWYQHPLAFYQATWLTSLQQPLRLDALNLNSWCYALYGIVLPAEVGMGLCLLGQIFVLAIGTRTPAGFCFGLAWSLLFWLSFHRQAFANYYHFLLSCLAAGITLAKWEPIQRSKQDATYLVPIQSSQASNSLPTT